MDKRRPPSERGELLPFRDRIPDRSYLVEVAPDTGGFLRPDWRPQDPASDPREPWSPESWDTGEDHGWSNCTMSAAALAYALDAGKQAGPWGGDFRHAQDDMSGGTDLYDAQVAWQRYGGRVLTIKNGTGWDDVERARAEQRPIVIQGEGNVPGSEAFDGGHACAISPEPDPDGRWLFGDPLANGWQWVTSSSIRTWAQALSSGIYFAVGSPMGSSSGGGGSGNMAMHARDQVGDVAAGVDFYDEPGGDRIGEMSKAMTLRTVGIPMDNSDDHLNHGWRAVYVTTQAIDGVSALKVVYVQTANIANLRATPVDPPPAGGDVDAALELRDAEWVDALTLEWPVQVHPVHPGE